MYKDYEVKLNAILDSHKDVKRFDFKDIKTLDKLTGQLKSLVSKLDDTKIKSEIGNFNKVNTEFNKAETQFEVERENLDLAEKKVAEVKKDLEKQEKQYLKFEKTYDKFVDKYNAAAKKVFNENDKYISTYNKAESISDKLEDAIELVEKGAKDIGLSVNVSQYETQVNNFNKLEENPLTKLDFDY